MAAARMLQKTETVSVQIWMKSREVIAAQGSGKAIIQAKQPVNPSLRWFRCA